MTEVEGETRLGEALAAGIAMSLRVNGRWRLVGLGLWAGLCGSAAAVGVRDWETGGRGWMFLAVFLVAWFVWSYGTRPLYRRLWRDLGAPATEHTRFSVAEDGLNVVSSGVASRVGWDAVIEIHGTPAYWLLILPERGFYVPRRFFATKGDERAFVAACLAHLPPEARARSRYANRLAAGDAV